MNTKHICGAVLSAAVLLVPSVLGAQTDPNNPSMNPGLGPSSQTQAAGSTVNGTQVTSASMRDSLGAPGQNGQQLLDQKFVRTAAENGLADVKLGTLALQKGGPDVKDLAQKLVDDHTAMNKEMGTVADGMGVMLPKKINKDDQTEYDKLNGMSGKDFDTEYLTYIVRAHWQNLHAFYMEASATTNADLQTQVVKDLGTMHQHLGLISKTATADGVTLPPRPPRPARPAATTTAKQ